MEKMLKSGPPQRGKRRNAEKRREKSRYAARNRREKEAGIFTDLYVTVPIVTESTITHVDRIAVLRLAATLCRIQRVVERVLPSDMKDPLAEPKDIFAEASVNEGLDGFLIMVDSSGLIVYISPNCSRSLGLTQTDLIGQNMHEYLHSDDSTSFRSLLDNAAEEKVHAMLRMKSVLSPRGRNLTLKSAVFKAVSFSVSKKVVEFPAIQPPTGPSPLAAAELSALNTTTSSGDISDLDFDDDGDSGNRGSPDATFGTTELDTTYYLMHGLPMIHCGAGAMGDYHGPGTFTTRHGMDMKFSFCHERLSDYLGYDSKELMASSFYSLIHPEDLPGVIGAFKELYRKGQAITGYYRMFVKSGGYVWVTTTANMVTHSSRGHGGQYIICVHHLIRDVENNDLLADIQQMSPSLLCKLESDRKVMKHSKIVGPSMEQMLQRTSTVNDYIALPNPSVTNGQPPQRVQLAGDGAISSSSSTSSCRPQADATRKYNPEWLFRTVGGTEARTYAGQQQSTRRSDECSNSTGPGGLSGPTTGREQYFDAAATNFHDIVVYNSPDTTTTNRAPTATQPKRAYPTAHDPLLVPANGAFGAISQADVEHVLFSDVSAPGVQFTRADAANRGQGGAAGAGRPAVPAAPTSQQTIMIGGPMTKDNLSMLAPFIHNDEILSLDFGADEDSRMAPNLVDELEALFSSSGEDLTSVRAYVPGPSTSEEGKIESIYRYLCDDQHQEGNTNKKPMAISDGYEPPPPLLLVDPSFGQDYHGLMPPPLGGGVAHHQGQPNFSIFD